MATNENLNILSGRALVETYRQNHAKIYQKESPDIPAEHASILKELLEGLSTLGFHSIQSFFDASNSIGDDWR